MADRSPVVVTVRNGVPLPVSDADAPAPCEPVNTRATSPQCPPPPALETDSV